jgi:hypothetical protein
VELPQESRAQEVGLFGRDQLVNARVPGCRLGEYIVQLVDRNGADCRLVVL